MSSGRIITIRFGGPDNPVLVQGEFVSEKDGLTTVKISDILTFTGKVVDNTGGLCGKSSEV